MISNEKQGETGEADEPEDRLADFTRDSRMVVLSAMALVVGAASAGVAYLLVQLISLIGNLAFFGAISIGTGGPFGAERPIIVTGGVLDDEHVRESTWRRLVAGDSRTRTT